MSLHSDLLKQAFFLARKEPKKPTQASLRRSVSAAYYALFHLLIYEATRSILPGSDYTSLRNRLARKFQHRNMKRAASELAKSELANKLIPANLVSVFKTKPLDKDLVNVASSFVDLQEARHDADYNLDKNFFRHQVLEIVNMTERAFHSWDKVRHTLEAKIFLIGLLDYNIIIKKWETSELLNLIIERFYFKSHKIHRTPFEEID